MPTQRGPDRPEIHVNIAGAGGNAFAILGAVTKATRKGGVGQQDIDAFLGEAKSGDFNHRLRTAMDTVDVPFSDIEDGGP